MHQADWHTSCSASSLVPKGLPFTLPGPSSAGWVLGSLTQEGVALTSVSPQRQWGPLQAG